jgi:phage FluMu protein Com
MVDNRYRTDWFELYELSKDVKGGSGHHAASAASSTDTVLCKECSKNVRKDSSDFVKMEFDAQLQSWKCPRCGGTERLKVRALTPTYIRKIQDKVLQKEMDVYSYLPFFEKVRSTYNYIISKNKEDFLERFDEYETLAIKDLLIKKEGYFMVHYDSSKKWKKRSCYIAGGQAYIHSNDSRYSSQYKSLINELARKVNYNKELIDNEGNLLLSISNELEAIGWPKRYLREKIEADIDHLRFSSF